MPNDFSRSDRVAGAIQKALAELIRRKVKDPRLTGIISVSAVNVTKDFSYAKVYISMLDEKKEHIDLTLDILNKASGFLRKELGHALKLRTLPQLKFVYDESLTYGNHLSKLIDDAISREEKDD